jgi:glycosyltransferase involved in cell wall biosynthesis
MTHLYKPKFSYIIPYRHSPDRIVPLRRIIEWLSGFQGIEVVVVEQDKVSKISELTLNVTHIFCESELPFNKAWAYNVALKRTTSSVLAFGDADFVMNPNELIEGLKNLEYFDCVIPTSKIVKLSPQESTMDIVSILKVQRDGFKSCMTDGLSLFKRETIQKIGGWNEDILGHGFTNQFQDLKIRRMLNYKQMEFTGYHMSHKNPQNDLGLFQRNKEILDFYTKENSDLNTHINMTVPKCGFLNKYQD